MASGLDLFLAHTNAKLVCQLPIKCGLLQSCTSLKYLVLLLVHRLSAQVFILLFNSIVHCIPEYQLYFYINVLNTYNECLGKGVSVSPTLCIAPYIDIWQKLFAQFLGSSMLVL